MKYIYLIRVHQYIKNFFIFAPLFFSFQFSNVNLLINSFYAFILFSLNASAIYILNDYMDVEEDKKHPVKKMRPLASGVVSKKVSLFLMLLLMFISLSVSFFFNLDFFYILVAYTVLNIFYTLKFKHIPIVDIFIISFGFVLRVLAGGVVINTPISFWLIIMTFLLAIFIAFAKRRDDLLFDFEARKSIYGYNLEFINGGMIIVSAVIIVCYILYTVSNDIVQKFQTEHLYLTSVFVIMGIMKYMQITFVEKKSGNPVKIALTNRFLQITILLWMVSFYIIVKIKW